MNLIHMYPKLPAVSALMASLSLAAQPLAISSFDRSGRLVATNTSAEQRYSLSWAASVEGLPSDSLSAVQARVAHGSSTAFRTAFTEPTAFFRVFLDPFATSDMEGDWTTQLLTVPNDTNDWTGWARFEMAFDASGTGTVTSLERSNGDTNVSNQTVSMTVTSDGTLLGFFPPPPVVALDKNTSYGVMDDGGGGCNLYTTVRRTDSGFATADLQGQWTLFGLTTSVAPLTGGGGWARLEVTFDDEGRGVFTSGLRADGSTNLPPPFSMSILSDGTGTSSVGLAWAMALGKNVIWSVGNDPGSGSFGFYVMIRRAASGFSTADAEGRWTMFELATRDEPSAFAGWGRYEASIGAQGQATFTEALRSNGDTNLPAPAAEDPWSALDATPFRQDGQNSVVVPADSDQQFFRLMRP